MHDRPAQDRAIATLTDLTPDASFALFVGGQHGLDGVLDHGTHEPTGVQLHLLAVHLQTIAEELDTDVHHVAELGLDAHEEMTKNAVSVSQPVDE